MLSMNEKVVLYSNGCPNCRTLKKMLNDSGIKYLENNSVEEMLSLGFDRVPVLVVNGENMDFSVAKEWISNRAGGRSVEKQ